MNKIMRILALAVPVLAVSGCYDPYVVDYDQSAVYVAYQYDLRSLVVGEDMKFDFGAVLGGVISNDRDRTVRLEINDDLVTGDLSTFGGDAPFTALEGMLGTAPVGTLSQSYVTDEVGAAGLEALTPLPSSHYSVSDNGKIVIKSGKHTGTVTLTASPEAFLSDEHVGPKPYYAIGWKITSADADTVLLSKSFGVIAIKCENRFFGDWYHGGKSKMTAADGSTTETAYPTRIPADANTAEVYTLTTVSPYVLEVNCFHNDREGKMLITASDGGVKVSSEDGRITDTGSGWNNAKLLQDRKLFLNYKYTGADGSVTEVSDTLSFRNRIRDGINEWQDENPAHYGN